MRADGLPAPAPERNPETEPFWSATSEGRLLLPRCERCQEVGWYPRSVCAACGGRSLTWEAASGRGRIYSFSVVHRGSGPFAGAVPYVVAYVELDEGPRVLTNIVGARPEELCIGQPVRVVFCDTGAGSALYRFEPVR